MSIEWNKTTVEILIESYKAKECLWNLKHPLYRNKIARRSALQQVVAELTGRKDGVSCNEITKKFNTLRTQYLSEVKKIRASERSGCAASEVYKPTVWWFSRINFLRNVLQRRRVVSNVLKHSPKEELPQFIEVHMPETDDEDEDDNEYAGNLPLNGCQTLVGARALSPTSRSLNSDSSPHREYEDEDNAVTPPPKCKVKKKVHPDPSHVGLSRLLENVGRAFSRQKPSDEASQFGEFIASKLRRLDSAALRLATEHEIMNIIMKAELQNLDTKLDGENREGQPYKFTSVGH
ncbi:uncharacterized protein LOC134530982 [Bacillus rossius redtenbacheri]|uniref:uncharacterized protein LOC134530982 n=1 Tax=Bacillus rossius redtenbacheri TaxID=93214 RepID=UPI002FDE9339